MSIGLVFWILMIVWSVFSHLGTPHSNLLLLVLFGILGYAAFGFPIK